MSDPSSSTAWLCESCHRDLHVGKKTLRLRNGRWLSEDGWVAVNTIIEEKTVRDLIPKVKAAGGQGIVEYPLNKIVM